MMGESQYCRLQSMDTVFTMLDCTILKMFWMLRRLLGQLMFSPAMIPLVCRFVVSTCTPTAQTLGQLECKSVVTLLIYCLDFQ